MGADFAGLQGGTWAAVRVGGSWRGSWPLVKMQLEPPLQAAGENHPADLLGEREEGRREVRRLVSCLPRSALEQVATLACTRGDLVKGRVQLRRPGGWGGGG